MSVNTLNVLDKIGDLSVADFLSSYWQKKPLFVKNAFPNLYAISPDELAGFSLESEVESRLIIETPNSKDKFASQWQLLHGPLNEAHFSSLPSTHWTLLVQAVNQLDSNLHALFNQFRFLPNWRVDDLMVSYAEQGGGVGPHFDYYDVFLIQAHGTRLWRLGQHCDAHTALQADQPLKLLTTFEDSNEYLVEPGDLLYIPPGLAHWGVAQGPCTTYSVGFRAPSHADILLDFSQDIASELFEHQRYQDNLRLAKANPGEIVQSDIEQVKGILREALSDDQKLARWFGRAMTEVKRSQLSFEQENAPSPKLNPAARAAYVQQGAQCLLFINGEEFVCSTALAQAVCSQQAIIVNDYNEESSLIFEWMEKEYLL